MEYSGNMDLGQTALGAGLTGAAGLAASIFVAALGVPTASYGAFMVASALCSAGLYLADRYDSHQSRFLRNLSNGSMITTATGALLLIGDLSTGPK